MIKLKQNNFVMGFIQKIYVILKGYDVKHDITYYALRTYIEITIKGYIDLKDMEVLIKYLSKVYSCFTIGVKFNCINGNNESGIVIIINYCE